MAEPIAHYFVLLLSRKGCSVLMKLWEFLVDILKSSGIEGRKEFERGLLQHNLFTCKARASDVFVNHGALVYPLDL